MTKRLEVVVPDVRELAEEPDVHAGRHGYTRWLRLCAGSPVSARIPNVGPGNQYTMICV
jgi:hypothetical protein